MTGNRSESFRQVAESRSEAGFHCPAYVGLRCWLLLLVMQGHYWFEHYPNSWIGNLSLTVPCFFALSGYLISHTLFRYELAASPGKAMLTFYLRRALRIFPVYYLVLLIVHAVQGIPYLLWHLTYTNNLNIFWLSAFDLGAFREYLSYRDFNGIHLWSVCVEEQYYLLYPWMLLALSPRRRTAGLWAALALCMGARWLCRHTCAHAFYGGLPLVAGEFILWGCLLAWMERCGRCNWLRSPWTLYGSLGLVLWGLSRDHSYYLWSNWKPPLHQTYYAALIAVFVASLRHCPGSWLAQFLAFRPFQAVGTLSYSAYVLHLFLNPLIDRSLDWLPWLAVFPQCPRALAGPLWTLSLAALLWLVFERPIQSYRQAIRLSKYQSGMATGEEPNSQQLKQEAEHHKGAEDRWGASGLAGGEEGEEHQHEAVLRNPQSMEQREQQ